VAGFDATFSAPKSVSLLFALGGPETSNEVRNAHDASVRAALGFLEAQASVGRRGRGGLFSVKGDGFVAAAFRHRTSRAAEPQLHTHVVVANLVHSPADGRWTALDARPFYRWARPVGHLYEAQLRWELTRRLGVGWGPVHHGIADVAGIPTGAIDAFSTRRRQIVEHLAAHGEDGGRAAQIAAYATRKPKDPDAQPEDLLNGWRVKAKDHGLDQHVLTAALHRSDPAAPPAPGTPAADRLFQQLASPEGLTIRRSTFGQVEVLEAICDRLPSGGRVTEIVALADAFLASPHLVALDPQLQAVGQPDAGEATIPSNRAFGRWTTPEMLATERHLLDLVAANRQAGAGTARPDHLEAALPSLPLLDSDQEAMVRQLCTSGAGVEVVEGVAGSGKTYALAAANAAWTTSGYRVRGACLAARTASRLQEGSGITSTTLDRLQRSLRHDPLTAGDVVVVDEAGMVGTRSLLRLIEEASKAQAKVVLIGDPRQLPELEAGGAFGGLTRRHQGAELTTNRRQHHAWERDALGDLRHGDSDNAFAAYLDHQRIHHTPTSDGARQQLVDDWLRSRLAGQDALMVASHLRAVDDLNGRARTALRAAGLLGPDQVTLGKLRYTTGDEVLALRNDYDLVILNGTRSVIDHIDPTQRRFAVLTDDGRRVQIPFDYAAAGYLTHGYATTIHKAQGATVDRCFILADETTTREHAYAALSRGRHGNDLYLFTDDRRAEEGHTPEINPDQLDRLRLSLGRSIRQHLATDSVDACLEQRSPAADLGDGPGW